MSPVATPGPDSKVLFHGRARFSNHAWWVGEDGAVTVTPTSSLEPVEDQWTYPTLVSISSTKDLKHVAPVAIVEGKDGRRRTEDYLLLLIRDYETQINVDDEVPSVYYNTCLVCLSRKKDTIVVRSIAIAETIGAVCALPAVDEPFGTARIAAMTCYDGSVFVLTAELNLQVVLDEGVLPSIAVSCCADEMALRVDPVHPTAKLAWEAGAPHVEIIVITQTCDIYRVDLRTRRYSQPLTFAGTVRTSEFLANIESLIRSGGLSSQFVETLSAGYLLLGSEEGGSVILLGVQGSSVMGGKAWSLTETSSRVLPVIVAQGRTVPNRLKKAPEGVYLVSEHADSTTISIIELSAEDGGHMDAVFNILPMQNASDAPSFVRFYTYPLPHDFNGRLALHRIYRHGERVDLIAFCGTLSSSTYTAVVELSDPLEEFLSQMNTDSTVLSTDNALLYDTYTALLRLRSTPSVRRLEKLYQTHTQLSAGDDVLSLLGGSVEDLPPANSYGANQWVREHDVPLRALLLDLCFFIENSAGVVVQDVQSWPSEQAAPLRQLRVWTDQRAAYWLRTFDTLLEHLADVKDSGISTEAAKKKKAVERVMAGRAESTPVTQWSAAAMAQWQRVGTSLAALYRALERLIGPSEGMGPEQDPYMKHLRQNALLSDRARILETHATHLAAIGYLHTNVVPKSKLIHCSKILLKAIETEAQPLLVGLLAKELAPTGDRALLRQMRNMNGLGLLMLCSVKGASFSPVTNPSVAQHLSLYLVGLAHGSDENPLAPHRDIGHDLSTLRAFMGAQAEQLSVDRNVNDFLTAMVLYDSILFALLGANDDLHTGTSFSSMHATGSKDELQRQATILHRIRYEVIRNGLLESVHTGLPFLTSADLLDRMRDPALGQVLEALPMLPLGGMPALAVGLNHEDAENTWSVAVRLEAMISHGRMVDALRETRRFAAVEMANADEASRSFGIEVEEGVKQLSKSIYNLFFDLCRRGGCLRDVTGLMLTDEEMERFIEYLSSCGTAKERDMAFVLLDGLGRAAAAFALASEMAEEVIAEDAGQESTDMDTGETAPGPLKQLNAMETQAHLLAARLAFLSLPNVLRADQREDIDHLLFPNAMQVQDRARERRRQAEEKRIRDHILNNATRSSPASALKHRQARAATIDQSSTPMMADISAMDESPPPGPSTNITPQKRSMGMKPLGPTDDVTSPMRKQQSPVKAKSPLAEFVQSALKQAPKTATAGGLKSPATTAALASSEASKRRQELKSLAAEGAPSSKPISPKVTRRAGTKKRQPKTKSSTEAQAAAAAKAVADALSLDSAALAQANEVTAAATAASVAEMTPRSASGPPPSPGRPRQRGKRGKAATAADNATTSGKTTAPTSKGRGRKGKTTAVDAASAAAAAAAAAAVAVTSTDSIPASTGRRSLRDRRKITRPDAFSPSNQTS
eukprot:Clim_evm1s154 gene=Clim_evmTU1s154